MRQTLIFADDGYATLSTYLKSLACKRVLLVHGNSMKRLAVGHYLLSMREKMGMEVVEFTDFTPNPEIESAIAGAHMCKNRGCDLIIACGGGSAMDIAKCIRVFCEADMETPDFWQHLHPGKLPLVAIPTTAGTGSEATHFAVVYHKGKKLSIGQKDNIPQAVVFDATAIINLPLRQKQSTYLDAMCHAIESYWSIKATVESRVYAGEALRLLCANRGYVSGKANISDCLAILLAAHYAGKAINISRTTAAHAMCYVLTKRFALRHGQAAALCLRYLWPYMLAKLPNETSAVQQNVKESFAGITEAMACDSVGESIELFTQIIKSCEWDKLQNVDGVRIDELINSVNIQRLQNHPIVLTRQDFKYLYQAIVRA